MVHPQSMLRIFYLFVATLFLSPSPSLAGEDKILSIDVAGNRYVESAAVLANVQSKVGEKLSKKQISRDVRALFKTGYFEDIHVEGVRKENGIAVTYVVKENPLIGELTILGNDEIVDKDLRPKLQMKPGRVFSEAILRADRNTIRKAYLKKGYYQVGIDARKKVLKDGRIALTLNISEGNVTHIKRIHFVGNEAFSDDILRDEIASRQSNFGSWFSDRDVFDRERFGGDAQMLQQYYLNHGYLDIKVESAQLSLTPDKQSFYLNFSLYEGPQYSIDQIDLQGDMVPSREALMEVLTMETGDIYSVTELRNSVQAMEQKVGDKGFAFVSVTPLFKRDTESQKLSITFDIEKGREIYVERIEISGNQKTNDNVARRELRQNEGERYKASAVKRSKERLQKLQLFSDVRVNLKKTEDQDRVNMNVELEDDKTGSFKLGAGYSQLEKIFVTASVQERNFLGKGYITNLSGDIGGATQNFSGQFADPYFLDSEVYASLNIYKNQAKLTDVVSYNQDSYGGGVGFGIPLSEFITYSVGYEYDRSKLGSVSTASSIALQAQVGTHTTGEFKNSISWDTRNRAVATTEGHYERVGVNVAGLGGDQKFYEAFASTKSYFDIGNGFVLSPAMELRAIRGLSGKDVPIYRRYSIGGVGTLRGFDSFGVSLRDPVTQEALGGDNQFTMALNLFFPLPYMETSGFRGVLFVDAGTVWGSINAALGGKTLSVNEQFSSSKIRSSTGVGIEWMSPVGPLSLAWGFPINKVQGDLERNFEFALGMGF